MKKINILIIIVSLLGVIISFIPFNEIKNTNNQNISITNLPSFKQNEIKIRGNKTILIEIDNTSNYDLSFKTSDATKIKIIDSSNNYVKIERLQLFTNKEKIELLVNDKIYDKCYISCFNEITDVIDISIFEKDSSIDVTKIENYKFEEKYYTIIFNLEKLNNNEDFEIDTLLELEDFLKENLAIELIRIVKKCISYEFYLDYDYVFSNFTYKTLFFKFDDVKYAITLEKGEKNTSAASV